MPADRRIEQRLHVVELIVGEVADLRRQARGEHRERVARAQDAHDLAQIVERTRRADLGDQPLARLAVPFDGVEGLAHALRRLVLKGAREALGGRGGRWSASTPRDLLGIGLGLARHQVAADPLPDRLEHRARNAAAMDVIGRSSTRNGSSGVKNRRARRADPLELLAGASLVIGIAQRRAAAPRARFATGNRAPLSSPRSSSAEQQSPRLRCQLPQIGA